MTAPQDTRTRAGLPAPRAVPAGSAGAVGVIPGPRLLSGVTDGPGIAAHRARWPQPARRSADELVALTAARRLRGRGGAGFPFSRKLSTAAGLRAGAGPSW